jgi:hypothetical protein
MSILRRSGTIPCLFRWEIPTVLVQLEGAPAVIFWLHYHLASLPRAPGALAGGGAADDPRGLRRAGVLPHGWVSIDRAHRKEGIVPFYEQMVRRVPPGEAGRRGMIPSDVESTSAIGGEIVRRIE